MNLPLFLAHGALGSWDEIGLVIVGVVIAGYLVVLFVGERRRQTAQAQPHSQEGPQSWID